MSSYGGRPDRSVFISYARSDTRFARELAERLRAEGIETFDDRSVGVGESFAGSLQEEIGRADSIVALMSPDFFASQWCQVELAAAMSQDKRVVPVLLRGRAEGPLAYLVHLDATGGSTEVAKGIADVLDEEAS